MVYLVRWKGFTANEDTWVPDANLMETVDLMEPFVEKTTELLAQVEAIKEDHESYGDNDDIGKTVPFAKKFRFLRPQYQQPISETSKSKQTASIGGTEYLLTNVSESCERL